MKMHHSALALCPAMDAYEELIELLDTHINEEIDAMSNDEVRVWLYALPYPAETARATYLAEGLTAACDQLTISVRGKLQKALDTDDDEIREIALWAAHMQMNEMKNVLHTHYDAYLRDALLSDGS